MNPLWGLLIGAAIVLVLFVSISVAATIGPHCRCGHHRKVHKGRNTECSGYLKTGKNAVGAQQWDFCPCRSYRPTGVRYWQRILHGTEERHR